MSFPLDSNEKISIKNTKFKEEVKWLDHFLERILKVQKRGKLNKDRCKKNIVN